MTVPAIDTRQPTKSALALTAILAGLVALVAVYLAIRGQLVSAATFKPFDSGSFATNIAPLLVISVVIERTIEVFFGIWREPEDRVVEQKVQAAKTVVALAAMTDAAPPADATNNLANATAEHAQRKLVNTRLAFLAGGTLGLVAALAGARLLSLLVATAPVPGIGWNLLDIFLTAGLLGGGADGFHHLTAAVSSFLQATQHKAENADPKP